MTWSSTATRGLTGPRRPLRRLGGFGSLASSIPLGFSAGRPLSPFSRAISARWAAAVRSRAATLLSNSRTSAFSSVGESASRSPGGAIPPGNQRQERRGSENRAAATSFAAGTQTGHGRRTEEFPSRPMRPSKELHSCLLEPRSDPMSGAWMTSTGHAVSDAPWLDMHFESARAEYEEALRFVGIAPGWTVLDAGCGSGGYIPLIGELAGATGRVAALDLAPENIAHVECLIQEGRCAAPVDLRVGSLLDLPFADATFDCVVRQRRPIPDAGGVCPRHRRVPPRDQTRRPRCCEGLRRNAPANSPAGSGHLGPAGRGTAGQGGCNRAAGRVLRTIAGALLPPGRADGSYAQELVLCARAGWSSAGRQRCPRPAGSSPWNCAFTRGSQPSTMFPHRTAKCCAPPRQTRTACSMILTSACASPSLLR